MGHQPHNAPEKKRKRRQKPAAEEAAPEVEAKAAAGPNDPTPPLTNRGCLTPTKAVVPTATGVLFHLDYLKFTLFKETEAAIQLVNEALLEPGGFEPLWFDLGPYNRWNRIVQGPGPVFVLEPKYCKETYTVIEIKGQGCVLLGLEPIQGFLRTLVDGPDKWHGLRGDLAFDHVPFSPRTVAKANRAGNINSRCFDADDRDWHSNVTGRTAYLGRRDQKSKTRRLRVYDSRGYTRCEGEFKKEWATKVMRTLATKPIKDWPIEALGLIRGMVDYVDRSANERAERCPLLPFWAKFVQGAERVRNLSPEDRRQRLDEDMRTAIGKSEAAIMRNSRKLWAVIEAFGEDYLIDRIKHHAGSRIDARDEAFALELKKWKYSGYAGLPGERPSVEDLPI